MKGLKIKIQALLLCGVLITGLFSSCASDENIDNGNKVNAGDKVLTLTLNTPKATTTSGAKTRATNMTQADITTKGTENKINRLTIGIFSSDGNTVRTIQELSSGTTSPSFSTSGATTTATLVTNSLKDGDKVLVAANAPTGTFNGCTTASSFQSKAIAIDVALTTPATDPADITKEATDNLPMYGDATTNTDPSVSGNGVIVAPVSPSTTYTAKVDVQHQLAKITLASLTVDFDPNGPYKSATFQPTSFFLLNVPQTLSFSNDASTGSTDFLHGWAAADGTTTPTVSTFKKYLGTDIFSTSYGAMSGTKTINPNNIFYTIPNSNTTNNTKLVIGGEFDADGSGSAASPTTVYYPVNINWVYDKTKTPADVPAESGSVAKQVYPNKNYKCLVTIKTMGAKSPSDKIDPEAASITVSVLSFTDVTQNTSFE